MGKRITGVYRSFSHAQDTETENRSGLSPKTNIRKMQIQSVRFYRSEPVRCDCCGQSIRNICEITEADGTIIRLGPDCYKKQIVDGLSRFQKTKVQDAENAIRHWEDQKAVWETLTEEVFLKDPWKYGVQASEENPYGASDSFKELREWMLHSLIPARIQRAETELVRSLSVKSKGTNHGNYV